MGLDVLVCDVNFETQEGTLTALRLAEALITFIRRCGVKEILLLNERLIKSSFYLFIFRLQQNGKRKFCSYSNIP